MILLFINGMAKKKKIEKRKSKKQKQIHEITECLID